MKYSDSENQDYQILRDPRFAVPMTLLALALLFWAVVVVVRNASRVKPGTASLYLGPVPRDTLMRRAQRKFRQGLVRLEKRMAGYRQYAATPSERAERLSRFCDSAMQELRMQAARFETTATAARRKKYFYTVDSTYVALRDSVNAFGRETGASEAGLDVDSLDRQFERLLSE